MKFKHSFNVFVDNFSITFKLLLFRVTVLVIFALLSSAAIYPLINNFSDSAFIKALSESFDALGKGFANLDLKDVEEALHGVRAAFDGLQEFMSEYSAQIAVCVVVILFIYIVEHFVLGLGNYTVGALINDKMALRASSPFIGTMIKNLGKASLYCLIYVPISIFYDIISAVIIWALVFMAFAFLPLLFKVFLFATVFIALLSLKMTLTTDWLPALIYGKMNNRAAMKYTFSRKGKKTANVYSNFLVMILIILALNVAATLFTFGAGLLLTVPASYIFIISFEYVNYCDRNELKYFVDANTIVKPNKETSISREQFFRGEDK